MYGQDDINIVYSDALSSGKAMEDRNIKDSSFSVLVANPPYSVKGFLETLSETERRKYDLIETIGEKRYPNNNSIEAFFIERAKQLLKPGGVAGIILPTSILTKGNTKSTSKSTNIYVATREILLKYFDIVAIAEFGKETFGKTGTNTVTLFIRRKKDNPAPADHFKNRVNAWFNYDKSKDGLFEDEHLLKQYCIHLELGFEDYQSLLEGKPNEALLATDIFKEYHKEFDKWSEIKSLKKKTTFKALASEKKEAELNKRFIAYLTENEKEKLYYFVLASHNPQKVLIVKSPSNSKKMKEFLGYEWSAAKGNEGIKYLSGVQLAKMEGEDEDEGNVALEEEDKRVLSNIFNLNNIITPLYDPHNKKNSEKINYLINQNFRLEEVEIPKDIASYVTKEDLRNTIDFTKPDFNKSISTVGEKLFIEIDKSIYPKKRIETLLIAINGYKTKINDNEIKERGKTPVITQDSFRLISGYTDEKKVINDLPLIVFGDHSFNFKIIDFDFIRGADGTQLLKFENELTTKYFYHFSKLIKINDRKYERHFKYLKDFKIPLPPPEVQQQIVNACSVIDKESEKAEIEIKKGYDKIEMLITDFSNQRYPTKKVSDLAETNPSKSDIRDLDENTIVSFIEMASVSEEGFISHKEDRLLKDVKSGSYRYFKEGDIIIAKITPCMENGKCAIATGLTNNIGFGSSEFHVFRVNELTTNKFLFAFLNREVIRKEAEKNMTGSSGHRRVPDSFYKNLQIPVPTDKKIQAKLISNIEKAENKIKASQDILVGINKRKETIIKSYLMGEVEEPKLALAAEPKGEYKKK